MKTLTYNLRSALFAALFFVCSVMNARAQFTSNVTSQRHDLSFSAGRDFWLAEMSNNWGVIDSNTYMRLYLSAEKPTTAFIAYRGTTHSLQIKKADSTYSYLLPESIQMESSGYVENKAIHVWSNDAAMIVSNMNTADYSCDGEYLIPSIGWGTDYVAAAYASLFEGDGTEIYDIPSELSVVSNSDNDTVFITPSCDCRRDTKGTVNGDANSSIVEYPAGETETFVLNKGQCLELMPIIPNGPDNFDLTGTIIHASEPVGLLSGSMEANIPPNFPYADHVEDMVPPVRTWGETYMGTSFHQPAGAPPGHDDGLYLLISSEANQTIYENDCQTGERVAANIGDQYGYFWDEEELGRKFWSNAPFLCVEYSNSSTYPDGVNGNGDPAEAHINPMEQFLKTVHLETPVGFSSYANVTLNNKDTAARFDSQPLISLPRQCVDANWSIITVSDIAGGFHTVTGDDSGVDVHLYGYGFDQSYAWSSESFEGTFNSPDSAAPIAQIGSNCSDARVTFTDTGASASLLSAIWLDSSFNATFSLDPACQEGVPTASDFFNSSVIDHTKPASLQVTAYDFAGNSTTVTLTYTPPKDTIVPPLNNLGVQVNPAPANIAYDTLINNDSVSFPLDSIYLSNGSLGFTLFDSVGGPIDRSPLPPHSRRIVLIQFSALTSKVVIDSIVFIRACDTQVVTIIGSGGANDFTVTNQNWNNELFPMPPGGFLKSVTIQNLSPIPITIDSMWWPDHFHFRAAIDSTTADPNFADTMSTLPITIPTSPGTATFYFAYFPSDTGGSWTPVSWFSKDVLKNGVDDPRFDTLNGSSMPLNDVSSPATQGEMPYLYSLDGQQIHAFVPTNWPSPLHLELVNTLGERVWTGSISGTAIVSTGTLVRGIYFWRMTTSHHSASGKLLFGE